jgi:hypothetical protein
MSSIDFRAQFGYNRAMKTVWISAVGGLAVVLVAGGTFLAINRQTPAAVRFARDEENRASQFHSLSGNVKADQARVKVLVDDWAAVCEAKHQKLAMGQDGDPGCQTPPAPAAPQK